MAKESLALAITAALWLNAPPAAALKPCHDICHLGQGQPLLLADVGQVLVVACTMARPGDFGSEKCVLLRLGLEGRVLDEESWRHTGDERALERRLLARHRVVRLDHQSEWKEPSRPYEHVNLSGRKMGVSLRLERDEIVLSRRGSARVERRSLGCVPLSLSVRASDHGSDEPGDPLGVLAIIATCKAGSGTREVPTVFVSSPP